MASNRWVAIDPDILTHPLVGAGQPVSPADPTRGAYSRMEAWVWIICNASFADHTVMNRGRKMTLQRGDLLGAWAFLAHTFNWSAKQVRLWVERLVADNMLQRRALDLQAEHGGEKEGDDQTFYGNQSTILSIVNYWRFQFERYEEGQPRGNQKDNQQDNQKGNQSNPLTPSELADKYFLQQQLGQPEGQPEGQPKGQHITNNNYPSSSNNNRMSEASSDEPAKKRSRRKKAAHYTEQFEVFWMAYPDRTNNTKANAFAEWERLSEPDQNAALASMPAFNAYCRKNPDYPCIHAERYLSYRRWETIAPAPPGTPWWKDPEQIKAVTLDRWRVGIAKHANGIWPVDKLGPAPGHAECIVPRELIDEMQLTEKYTERGIARMGHRHD